MSDKAGCFRLLTPPGEGGIAVFAVEGPLARAALLKAVRSPRLATLKPGELAYGKLVSTGGEVLDEVIVAALPPRPDGSERLELNCHAGGAAAAAAAERLKALGFEERAEAPEEPGLTSAEAGFRRALVEVKTRRQLEALLAARAGRPDPQLKAVLAIHRVVIAGPVNAGKSTLFNRLAGADRAIVSPHPGTTRDAVVAEVSVRGLAVELVDTAGLGRLAGDALAESAQEMTREAAASADLVLLVLDGSAPMGEAERAEVERLLASPRRAIVVLNKSDLPGSSGSPVTSVCVSALTGAGLDELAAAIERALLAQSSAG